MRMSACGVNCYIEQSCSRELFYFTCAKNCCQGRRLDGKSRIVQDCERNTGDSSHVENWNNESNPRIPFPRLVL